jgi:predicted glycoside hydrolase/deacetylase ChbG (UPF0249 family)
MTGCVLIVNADDFGLSAGVNEGIARAHEDGIVTSASLMVRAPAAADAAAYGGRLAVGLHLDLGEWEYRDGGWQARYEVLGELTPESVAAELERQLEAFERLRGRPPTHIDSHQHVHMDEPVRSVALGAAARLGVPLRALSGIPYDGSFYGQDGTGTPYPHEIEPASLLAKIAALPEGRTELGCHPAAAPEPGTTYSAERVRELETLCDPRVRAAIDAAGIALRSFAEI